MQAGGVDVFPAMTLRLRWGEHGAPSDSWVAAERLRFGRVAHSSGSDGVGHGLVSLRQPMRFGMCLHLGVLCGRCGAGFQAADHGGPAAAWIGSGRRERWL